MSLRRAPVEALISAYNALMAGVWILTAPGTPLTIGAAALHLILAALPAILRPRDPHSVPTRPTLRDATPLLGIALFWTELGILNQARRVVTHDGLVAAWDQGLFGLHWHAVWRPSMPEAWFSETMHFSYFAYYLLLAVPPIVVALTGRREAFRDVVLRLMATYVTCFAIYALFPVAGPRSIGLGQADGIASGFFHALVERAREAGDSVGTAFPSSHVAGAVTIAWIGCRWFRPPLAALLVVQAVMVTLATVYTQNHFAVDALAGGVWAITVQTVLVPALSRPADGAC